MLDPNVPHYRFKDEANRVQDFMLMEMSSDPLLGYVWLDTDHGRVVCAVNRAIAQHMVESLTKFLDGKAEKLEQ